MRAKEGVRGSSWDPSGGRRGRGGREREEGKIVKMEEK